MKCADGQEVAYNLRFPGQYYQAETGLNQNWNRDYDPIVGRYIESDPIGLAAGVNTYAYALDSTLRNTDPTGLDIWIEGPSGNEPSFHESINVGDPNGTYNSYSYGMNGNWLQGEVYRDTSLGGPIEEYRQTTAQEDAQFKNYLESQLGKTGIYAYEDTCRSWSQRQFGLAPGKKIPPPPRVPVPHTNVSPWSTRSTTSTTSTTGTSTSR